MRSRHAFNDVVMQDRTKPIRKTSGEAVDSEPTASRACDGDLMLRIVVEIVPGGVGKPRELAQAVLGNMSDLADRSDYAVRAREGANILADAPAWDSHGHILSHDRKQTVWRLVEGAAKWAAEQADNVARKL